MPLRIKTDQSFRSVPKTNFGKWFEPSVPGPVPTTCSGCESRTRARTPLRAHMKTYIYLQSHTKHTLCRYPSNTQREKLLRFIEISPVCFLALKHSRLSNKRFVRVKLFFFLGMDDIAYSLPLAGWCFKRMRKKEEKMTGTQKVWQKKVEKKFRFLKLYFWFITCRL